jgi:protein subunit release factor B
MKYYFFIKSWDKHNSSSRDIGPELADAVGIIERMYMRYLSERELWVKNEMHHEHELAGSIETMFSVDLPDDSLTQEIGIHTVVKKSVFDKNGRRYTNFVRVFICDEKSVNSFQLLKEDIQTVRLYGYGVYLLGQGGMTHTPSKISISCSGIKKGLILLKVAVMSSQIEYEKIRRYTFDPYQRVTNELTGAYTEEIGRVVDGELDLIYNAIPDEKDEEDIIEDEITGDEEE